MVDKNLHLPLSLVERVDRYANARKVSRNVAFEELLAYLMEGNAGISEEMFRLACREAGFPRFL